MRFRFALLCCLVFMLVGCASSPYSRESSESTAEFKFVVPEGPWSIFYSINVAPPKGRWERVSDKHNLIFSGRGKIYRAFLPLGQPVHLSALHSAGYYKCKLVLGFQVDVAREYHVISRSDLKKGCSTGVFYQEDGKWLQVEMTKIK
jgi:hypothetical protein